MGGKVFTIIFIIESMLKIIGMGFLFEKGSYLRDYWNILDFTIVLSGIIELFFKTINFKSLRILRILRPLKTINSVPTMRKLVSTLLASLPELMNVTIYLLFIITVFAILGLQIFNGIMYNRCRYESTPTGNFWDYDESNTRICSLNEHYGSYHCPSG